MDLLIGLLGGLIVNGYNSGVSISLLPVAGSYAVNVDQFAAGLQTRVLPLRDGLALATPLGDADIPAASVIRRGKTRYVPITLLAQALAARITFDRSEFALRVALPWAPGAAAGQSEVSPQTLNETPDIRAPLASLSQIHSEAYFNRIDGIDSFSSLTDLAGALGPGMWSTQILTASPGGRAAMQYYGWTFDHGDNRVYLGHDEIALDPLLPYANLTGVQYAWSNRPDISYGSDLGNHQLVASQTLGGETLSGKDGPPGGIAELRVDGKVVARTAILLNGTWTFRHVVLRGTEDAEVALYQPFGNTTPTRVVPVNAATSPRSLPAGTIVSYAGVGMNGNPLDPSVHTHGLGAFYQLRWGVSNRLTLDTATQQIDGRNYTVGNAIVGMGPLGTWGFGLAHSGNAEAWSITGNGQHGMWFWNGYALETGAGYYPGIDTVTSNRYGELGLHVNPRLDLSLVGSDSDDPVTGSRYRFVKPAISWRVTDRFNFSARPDFNGSYDLTADWVADRNTQVALSRYAGMSQIDITRSLPRELRLDLTATHVPLLGTRYAQTLSGMTLNAHPVTWSAGLLEGNQHIGYLLGAAMQAIPGLSLQAQIYNDPLARGINGGTIVQLSLVADFAVTSSGLAASNYSPQAVRRGSISGRVTGTLPDHATWADLAGAEVLVDGKPIGTLDRDAHYFVGNLTPGIHQIQLDTGKIPIDLVPVKPSLLVEVRAGATTRADIALTLQLGCAGRVYSKDGRPMQGATIVALDPRGHVVGNAKTGPLGFYRIDGLPPGHYSLRSGTHTREITLTRSFVYGQNFGKSATPR